MLSDAGPDAGTAFGVGVAGQGTGPGDVAVAGWVQGVAALAEDPPGSGVGFAQGEVVRGDVGFGAREMFFGNGELVHKREAEVVFFGGKVHFGKGPREFAGGFPTDLAAEAGLVAGGLNVREVLHKIEEDGFEEMPILGATGKQGAEVELVAVGLIDVEGGEVALA